MSNFKEMWPLAFVLAMASGASQADAPIDTSPAAFFRAGSLADALRNTSTVDEGERAAIGNWPDPAGAMVQLLQLLQRGLAEVLSGVAACPDRFAADAVL